MSKICPWVPFSFQLIFALQHLRPVNDLRLLLLIPKDTMQSVPYLSPRKYSTYSYSPPGGEAGLEVGLDPYRSPHTGWPDATKAVWGLEPSSSSNDRLIGNEQAISGNEQVIERNRGERSSPKPKAGARLGWLKFSGYWWIIAMMFCAFGAGVGSGVGLGIALRPLKCAT